MESELAYSGRFFGGKSWMLCAKALLYAASYPGAHVGLCREERASMESTTLRTLREEIVPSAMWEAGWRESKSRLMLPNRSEIDVFGLDKPGRALGSRYGFLGIDQAEQLDRNQFELINSRVTQVGMPWHQTALAFNPEGPDHWAYRRYRPDDGDGVRRDAKGVQFAEVVHVGENDLLEFLDEKSIARLDRLEGAWRLRYRLGMWTSFEGAVFSNWDPAVRVIPAPEAWGAWGGFPPPNWERYRGFDFGYDDPFVCQWWAKEPGFERYYRYREIYRSGITIERAAERVNELEAEEMAALKSAAAEQKIEDLDEYLMAMNIGASYSDHQRGERAMLADRGIATAPASKEIRAGIQTLLGLMEKQDRGVFLIQGAREECDMQLAERNLPTCTEDEMAGYRWKKRDGEGDSSKDLPVDKNNHGIDTMRYVFHSLATYGRFGVWA